MRFFPLLMGTLLVLTAGSLEAEEQYAEPIGPEAAAGEECQDCGPAGDPVIYPGEVIAPALESEDGALGPWFEDPGSVNCEAAPAWCRSEAFQVAQEAQAGEA